MPLTADCRSVGVSCIEAKVLVVDVLHCMLEFCERPCEQNYNWHLLSVLGTAAAERCSAAWWMYSLHVKST